MNVDAVDSVVALLHHVHAPTGEAVRPLGQAHHQHRPAEVDERKGLNRDGGARDGIDQLRGHVLVKSVWSGVYMSQMLYAGQSARPNVTFLSDF